MKIIDTIEGQHTYCRYEDGSGGCDGCLDYTNMGVVFHSSKRQIFPNSGLEERKNNNMAMTVLALEHIYTRGPIQ